LGNCSFAVWQQRCSEMSDMSLKIIALVLALEFLVIWVAQQAENAVNLTRQHSWRC